MNVAAAREKALLKLRAAREAHAKAQGEHNEAFCQKESAWRYSFHAKNDEREAEEKLAAAILAINEAGTELLELIF